MNNELKPCPFCEAPRKPTYEELEKMVKPLEWKQIQNKIIANVSDMNFSIEPTEGLFHVFFEDDCGNFTVINTLCTLEMAKQAAQEWLVDLVADALGMERSGKCADFLK